MLVMNVDGLTPLAPYREAARAFLDRVKATPPAPGFDEVIVPGDYEHRSRGERLRAGIEIPQPTWAETGGVRAHPRRRPRGHRLGTWGRGPVPRLTIREATPKETRRWNTGEWGAPA